jgi:hypothetical protein
MAQKVPFSCLLRPPLLLPQACIEVLLSQIK